MNTLRKDFGHLSYLLSGIPQSETFTARDYESRMDTDYQRISVYLIELEDDRYIFRDFKQPLSEPTEWGLTEKGRGAMEVLFGYGWEAQ